MKIILIARIGGNLDEGMKNATYHIYNNLKEKADVKLIDPNKMLSITSMINLYKFRPSIIHYTMGPTFKGMLLLRILSIFLLSANFIVSAPRPQLKPWHINFLFGFKPKLVLIQSLNHKKYFNLLGYKTKFFPPGVDIYKFSEVDYNYKTKIKKSLGLSKYKKIALHVGQITKIRQLDKLIAVQEDSEYQVVIIGASSIRPNNKLKQRLLDSGIIIIESYVERLEEYYQVSDVFIFPGTITTHNAEASATELPLTVFEALSCNIPIITGKFGGLPELFYEDEFFRYANSNEEIINSLKGLDGLNKKIKNREKVVKYSWGALTDKLIDIYCS